jgi:hypothetical protein
MRLYSVDPGEYRAGERFQKRSKKTPSTNASNKRLQETPLRKNASDAVKIKSPAAPAAGPFI